MSRDDDLTVVTMGRGSDGRALILVSGSDRDSMLRSILDRVKDNRYDLIIEACEDAEELRDNHYASRGELRRGITRLVELLRQVAADE